MTIRILLVLLLASSIISSTLPGRLNADESITNRLFNHVAYLADDAREGRGIGTAGLDSAAQYIADYFSNLSLQTMFPGSYFQKFDLDWGVEPLKGREIQPLGFSNDTLAVQIRDDKIPVKNVGAVLEGDSRVIVLGAHYDHLGYGQEGSTAPGVHAVYNGADDNASGVAVLLELARYFQQNPPGPTLWFLAFTGEEVDLAGSNWFVHHPPQPLDSIRFMFNFDTVGRMQDSTLILLGIRSAIELEPLAKQAAEGLPIRLAMSGNDYGSSDQTSFYSERIPVLQALTAAHEDYHSPGDDVEKLNFIGLKNVFDFSRRFIEVLAEPGVALTYVEKAPPIELQDMGSQSHPYLGTIPDFAQPDSVHGVRLQGICSGSPAELAGLQKGDILIRMDEVIIDNIYDFTFTLRQKKAGDEVEVQFIRNGETLSTKAVLANPKR